MSFLESVVIDCDGPPDGSVIWLHGLGADGHDFEPIVPELALPAGLNLRFVFPHAPVRPVTINGGISMRAWYDIYSFDRDAPVDETGIRESSQQVVDLVNREHGRGIDYSRILLAGFSQGGAIALHTAVRFPQRLAGLMALSTYLPLQSTLESELNPENLSLPIFMAHGSLDPVLPVQLGMQSRDRLVSSGFSVAWHDYVMAHAVNGQEIADIRDWLLGIYDASI